MKKRFSKPGRRRRARSSGQGSHQLRKTVRELYPTDGLTGDDSGWSDDALDTLDGLATPEPAAHRKGRTKPVATTPEAGASGIEDAIGTKETPGDPSAAAAKVIEARVVALASGRCTVVDDQGERYDGHLPSRLARDQRSQIAAGDRITMEWDEDGIPWVVAVAPRTTVLSRPDPLNPREERVIAANVDVVVHVQSVRQPPLRPALIDRYLIAIERSGARPVVCINKVDLLTPDQRTTLDATLAPYRAQDVPVLYCSADQGDGIAALRQHLAGQLGVFVGHSGVGKSSLLNALATEERAATGALSSRSNTGRHTTTGSELHRLPGGVEIIDTPGIRELGLWDLDPDALLRAFPEIEALARQCRFNDCAHGAEPGCAVRAAVADGTLSASRHAAFERIRDSLPT